MPGEPSGVEAGVETPMPTSPDATTPLEPLDAPVVAARLCEMFGLRDCRYEPFPFDVQLPRIEEGRVVLPSAEPGAASWQLDAGVELPVRAGDLLLGRFVLVASAPTSGVRFSPAQRAEAIDLAARVAPTIIDAILA
jgi:hypothetical protein